VCAYYFYIKFISNQSCFFTIFEMLLKRLLLENIPEDYSGPHHVSSVAEFQVKTVEPVGERYHYLWMSKFSSKTLKIKTSKSSSESASSQEIIRPISESERREMLLLAQGGGSHYALLGLEDLNLNATEDQIKKAYRKLILRLHPDKSGSASSPSPMSPSGTPPVDNASDPLFLAVQHAFDTLSDKSKRIIYDSEYDFDDSIPSENAKGDFFNVYGPVFERNSRWSKIKPVPLLGKSTDPMETVEKFYNFWFKFDSWREFTGDKKAEDASWRGERRMLERENKKIADKAKAKEVERIAKLVSQAYARDPRILAMKKAEEDAKKALRDEKINKKKNAEAEKLRLEQEAKEKEAAAILAQKTEALAAKNAKEAEKKAFKRATKELKALLTSAIESLKTQGTPNVVDFSEYDIEVLMQVHSTSAEMQSLVQRLETLSFDELVTDVHQVVQSKEKSTKMNAPKPKAEEKVETHPQPPAETKEKREWTVPELSMLAKFCAKFPGGVRNRWEVIAEAMTGQGFERTAEECVSKSHHMGDEERKKANAESFQVYASTLVNKGIHLDSSAGTTAAETAETHEHVDHKEHDAETLEEWTLQQQAALEQALKTYPATMEKHERWKNIANAVEGKNVKQCIARFSDIREKILHSK
jgi:DnaJ homolog subfamily C member 2